MADNVAITAGSGTAIAADDIASVWHQRVKLSLGADGTAVDAVAGAGVVGTGVQRMTLASDDPAVVDLAAIEVLNTARNTLLGAVTETAPASDTASSGLNGRLQRISQRLTSLISQIPATLGIKTASNSMSVVLASDQAAVPIQHATRAARGRQVTTITSSTSETTIVSAGATGVLRDLFCLIITNTSASTCNITIKDATAGTTVAVFTVAGLSTDGFVLSACDAWKQTTAANNWTATCSASVASISISAFYVEN